MIYKVYIFSAASENSLKFCFGVCSLDLVIEMSSDDQAARAQLRLGFISVMNCLAGRRATIISCEGNNLECDFVRIDREGEKLAVENLVTPTGKLNHAILRTSDVDRIQFLKESE